MRIYEQNLTGAAGAEAGRTHETQRADHAGGDSRTSAAGHSGDRVEFSQTLDRLSRALAHEGGSRAAKVQALAARYQSGNYQPDSRAVSRSMVSEALGG
jgi:anti-sigma28 factor (negative regulator of flagellin synthesis)